MVIAASGCSLYFDEPTSPPPAPAPQQPTWGITPPRPRPPAPLYATLSTGTPDIWDIAIDDTYVYWLVNHQNASGSAVYRIPKTGGQSEQLATIDGIVYEFAVDDAYIYLPLYAQQPPGGAFLRMPKGGGPTEVIDDHLLYMAFVAVDSTSVYVSPCPSPDPPTPDCQLWRYPKSGGPHDMLVDGALGPDSLAFDATNLYFTNTGNSELLAAPLGGGPPVQPLPGLDALRVVADADNLYFLSGAIDDCPDGRISAWSRTGTMLRDLGASPTCPLDLAVAQTAVFSVEESSGKVVEFPLDGSGRQELVTGLSAPMAIAAEPDGSAIYWGDFQTGEVDRLDL